MNSRLSLMVHLCVALKRLGGQLKIIYFQITVLKSEYIMLRSSFKNLRTTSVLLAVIFIVKQAFSQTDFI